MYVRNGFFVSGCLLGVFFAVLACCVPLQLDALTVTGNGYTISNGDTTPQAKDGTDFGLEPIGFYRRNTFTIVNNGSSSITIENIFKEDDFPPPPPYTVYKHSFFIYDITPGALAPGESCTFSVSFGPQFYEAGKASIVISYSYKFNNYQYRFAVAGETDEILPRIRVYQYCGIEVPNQLVSAYQENVAPPCVDNGTDYGAIPVEDGKPDYQLSTFFVITNTGPSSISIYNGAGGDPVHVTGDQDDFSVILQPTITSIPPGGTSIFMVLFDPTAGGVRNAEISFNYDDGWMPSYIDNDTYIFPVTGVGQAPEINIPQVLTGGTYDFGIVPVSSGTKTDSFTIENQGLYELDLTGAPRVAVSGTHAADFTVTSVPVSPVAPGGESTFSIRFDPSAGGVRTATVSIANNDANESPYTFIVRGTGGVQEMAVHGNLIEIPCGDLSPRTADGTDFGEVRADGTVVQHFFSIRNCGHDTLTLTGNPLIQIGGTHAADFVVSSTPDESIEPGSYDSFTIHFTPGGVGLREATLTIPNNDPDENPYVFAIQGTGIMPEIAVRGNGYEIADGDSSPRLADGTDFGEVSAYVETCQRTFTIHNTGTADLHLTYDPIYIELPFSPYFDVTGLPTSPVQPGGSTSFTITYAPHSAGVHDQIVSIRNDDSDENPYTFTIRGTCVTPEMRVTGDGVWISDGNTFTAYDDLTEFGCVRTSAPLAHTFAIENNGTEALALTGNPPVQTSGPAAAQFQVSRAPALSVAANGGSTDFDLRFAPSCGGRMTATVEIPSNDPGSNPYTYAVAGWGLQDISDQDPVAGMAATNAYVFDIVSWDWACMTLTPLSGLFDLSVYKGEQFNEGALGMSTHTLQTTDFVVLNGHLLGSGAHAAKIYGPAAGSYLVECETYVPDLTVGITYSQYAFEANDRADMYEVNLQGGTRYRIRVESQSTDTVLYLFSPRKQSATSLDCHAFSDRGGVGAYEQIEFNAMDAGFYGILVVDQEGTGGGYDISVRTGPEINISQGFVPGGCQIANGDDSPSEEDGTDFGVTPVNSFSPLSTFVIENTGVANLMLTNTPAVRFTGSDALAFNVFEAPSETIIEPEDYTIFRLKFSPHDSGMHTATVNIANNDADENPYTFAVRGFAAHQLTLDEPKSFTGVPEYADFNGEGWIAVGAKWLVSPLDLRLSASSNTTWTEEYATSDLPGNVTEFIARSVPDGAPSHYIKLDGDAGDSAMEIDSDWSELVTGDSRQITMSNFDVLEMFGIELTAGTNYLAAIDAAGFLGDLDMSLFILRPDRTCGSRTDCDWSACPLAGADRAEVSFTAPVSGRYIVIVTHESDQSHSCNLLIKEKARNNGTLIKLSCVF